MNPRAQSDGMLRRGRLRSKSQEGEETPHNRVSLLLTPETGIYIKPAEHFAAIRGPLTALWQSPHPPSRPYAPTGLLALTNGAPTP